MKKIVASVLAVIFILSSISGACTPVFASESLVENGSESVLDEGIPTDSAMDLYEEENSFELETEEIEAAEEPDAADIPEEEDAPVNFDVPDDESSLSDALIPEDSPSVNEQSEIPADTESVAATQEVQEEIVGTADSTGTDAEIATGDYYLITGINGKSALHIKGQSTANSANVTLYAKNGCDAQRFHVTNYGNGVYGITNIFSSKALTVSGASAKAGANVVQYTNGNTDNRRWYIQKASKSGYCTIQTLLSKNVLSVEGGKAVNFANVFVDTNKNANSQQWKFVKCEVQTTPWTKNNMKTGYYMIQSKLDSSRYLEVAGDSWLNGGNIQLGPTCSKSSRVFYITNLGNGRFRMQACVSGHFMEVTANKMAAGTNIRQGTKTDTAKQIFYSSTNRDDGYYFIKPSQDINHFAVGVKSGNTALGTNIYLTKPNPCYKAQMFKFVPVSAPNTEVKEGAYQIKYTNHSSYVVTIPGKNNTDNSTATLYKNESNNFQKYTIVPLGDGYCKILVASNQKALTVKGNATGNNVDVVQQTYKGLNGQKWKIKGCRNRFKIISKLNGKALTSNASSPSNNTNLKMYTDSSTYNGVQTFGLYVTTVTSSSDRGYVYQTDPVTKKSFKLEKQYLTDPSVSDTDFMAAVLYTEAGDQGIAGMMMVGYVIKTRMAEGAAAAKAGNFVEYPGTLKLMIYHYGQWQVARDGALTRVLTDISVGEASYLSKARTAAANVGAKKNIVLEADATRYVKSSATSSTKTTLKSGTQIKPSAFIYNSFMTPAAWNRYANSGSYPKFASGYGAGKNMLLYRGHVFFLDAEVW